MNSLILFNNEIKVHIQIIFISKSLKQCRKDTKMNPQESEINDNTIKLILGFTPDLISLRTSLRRA